MVTNATFSMCLSKSKMQFLSMVDVIALTVLYWTFCFFVQLHFGFWLSGFDVTFLSCPLRIFDILSMQLYLTLTGFLLKFCEVCTQSTQRRRKEVLKTSHFLSQRRLRLVSNESRDELLSRRRQDVFQETS